MKPRSFSTRHALESCTLQLHAWNPFHHYHRAAAAASSSDPLNPSAKKPCNADRSTAPDISTLDFSRLSLVDDTCHKKSRGRDFGLLAARKRRRHGGGSRSASGRSSDRSGTRRRCCSMGTVGGASGAYATCSDFPVAACGTDSSGELFMTGDGSWGSDASEARVLRKEVKDVGSGGSGLEKESSGSGSFLGGIVISDSQGNESGYGSETGYKGDAEFGYEDEVDEEEDDGRTLFWGDRLGDNYRSEFVDEDAFSEMKSQPRGRRKKQDWKIIPPLR